MKILIYSPAFYPSIGGLEMMASILAHEFVNQGHDVKLVCQTDTSDSIQFPFEVHRRISPYQLLKLARWCDVYFQANISLKGIWPLLIKSKPFAVSHNGWYCRPDGRVGWQDRLKQLVARASCNISVSRAVADHLSSQSVVIPNAYRDEIFHLIPEVPREKDLVFLGRLVSDKGADLLLDALAKLKDQNLFPNLSLIGSGPEEKNLYQQAERLGINNQIKFVGLKTGLELTRMLNEHRIMVVPSRWQEPFGIVALEGIACGCVVVGSVGGGLRDAIGNCGVTFPNGDAEGLTKALAGLLGSDEKLAEHRSYADAHLLRHRKEQIGKSYLAVLQSIMT
jgi:glycosyltransferase involved in cell wall biosynthesis